MIGLRIVGLSPIFMLSKSDVYEHLELYLKIILKCHKFFENS